MNRTKQIKQQKLLQNTPNCSWSLQVLHSNK